MPDPEREALAQLYGAKPEEFTALRKTLSDAAKARGDAAAAKRISASHKPTTAAWVLNTIARSNDAKDRLADLGERLRTAHAAMDGDGIRALSAAQRKLIDELVRAGFAAVALTNPSSALREDITGTLQAAIADPDVLARLGQLAKAERWSGFGEFGSSTAVSTQVASKKAAAPSKAAPAKTAKPSAADTREREKKLAREEREKARAVLVEAERAKAETDDEMSQRQRELAAARRSHDEARAALRAAERELAAAEESADDAERANHEAAQRVNEAKKQLKAKG